MKLLPRLRVSTEVANLHKMQIMEEQGGYAVTNLDENNPGAHLELSIKIGVLETPVLHSWKQEDGHRHVCCVDNNDGQKAYAWLLDNGAELIENT